MNRHPEIWNKPWHARLKNVAEVAATTGEFCFSVVRARSAVGAQSVVHAQSAVGAQGAVRVQSAVRAQSPVIPAASWLGRARCRATPAHVAPR